MREIKSPLSGIRSPFGARRGGGGGAPVTPWILATGAWDDSQPWADTETWKDAA